MKALNEFPRIPLGIFPTPLYKLEALSRDAGKNIYIKRDDLTGVALGGNKVRKLEYLLADAKERGADTILTAGGPQSNHAMLTAACASRLGMKAILVLKKRGECSGGNLILDHIFDADVDFVDSDDYADVYGRMDEIMTELQRDGHTPYAIPVGGSVPLGSLGYVRCAQEIANQERVLGIHFDAIVSAVGSGGTYAGLTYGAQMFLPHTRSIGIGVCDEPFSGITYDLMRGLQELMESPLEADRQNIHIHYHIGPGYARSSAKGSAAIQRIARKEGILLDPVYSGKALAGLWDLLHEGYFDNSENILFVHTGGAGALFAVDLLLSP